MNGISRILLIIAICLMTTGGSIASDKDSPLLSESATEHCLCAQTAFRMWADSEGILISYSLHVRQAAGQIGWFFLRKSADVTILFYDKDKKLMKKKSDHRIYVTDGIVSGEEGASCLSLIIADVPLEAEYISTYFNSESLKSGLIKLPKRPFD